MGFINIINVKQGFWRDVDDGQGGTTPQFFQASGDPADDATEVLQAAIDAVHDAMNGQEDMPVRPNTNQPERVFTIYIPAGTYSITTTLRSDYRGGQIQIRGAGPNVTIIRKTANNAHPGDTRWNANAVLFFDNAGGGQHDYTANIELSDLSLSGHANNTNPEYFANGADECNLYTNWVTYALFMPYAHGIRIKNVRLQNCMFGLLTRDCFLSTVQNMVIENCFMGLDWGSITNSDGEHDFNNCDYLEEFDGTGTFFIPTGGTSVEFTNIHAVNCQTGFRIGKLSYSSMQACVAEDTHRAFDLRRTDVGLNSCVAWQVGRNDMEPKAYVIRLMSGNRCINAFTAAEIALPTTGNETCIIHSAPFIWSGDNAETSFNACSFAGQTSFSNNNRLILKGRDTVFTQATFNQCNLPGSSTDDDYTNPITATFLDEDGITMRSVDSNQTGLRTNGHWQSFKSGAAAPALSPGRPGDIVYREDPQSGADNFLAWRADGSTWVRFYRII